MGNIEKLIIFFIISFLLFFFIANFSYKLNLIDRPNHRKIHLTNTAYTGGIAFMICYILILILFDFKYTKLNSILSFSSIIAIIGFVDDKWSLNIGGKLSLQIIPILFLILFEKIFISYLGDYTIFKHYFQLYAKSLSIPLTLLAIIFLVNSFNYFDGIDGCLSIAALSVILILYFLIVDNNIRFYLILLSIPLLTFLFFNFSLFNLPKLFLGDSGSMLLGFVLSFTIIYISSLKIIHPLLLLWSISIFIYEFLAINFIRLIKKKNIFKPGLDHLHHEIKNKIKSNFITDIIIASLNIFSFILGYYMFNIFNATISALFFILLFIIYFFIRKK